MGKYGIDGIKNKSELELPPTHSAVKTFRSNVCYNIGEIKDMKHQVKQLVLGGLALTLATCGGSGAAVKATTPTEVMNRVEVGMTDLEVAEVVDREYFVENHAFALVNFSELVASPYGVNYRVAEGPDSPFHGWLFFGVAVRDPDPALVVFEAAGGTVAFVDRVPSDGARELVELESGRWLWEW